MFERILRDISQRKLNINPDLTEFINSDVLNQNFFLTILVQVFETILHAERLRLIERSQWRLSGVWGKAMIVSSTSSYSVCKEAPGLLLGLWSWYTKSLGNGSLASNPVFFSFFFWSSNHNDWCAQHSFIAGNAMYKIRPEQTGKTQFAGRKKKSMCIPFHRFSVPPPTLYLWNPDQFLNDRSSLWRTHRGLVCMACSLTTGGSAAALSFHVGGVRSGRREILPVGCDVSSKSDCSLYLKSFSSTLIPEQCLLDGLAHREEETGRWLTGKSGVVGINVDITIKIGTKCKDVCILFKFPKELSVTKKDLNNQIDKNCCGFFVCAY